MASDEIYGYGNLGAAPVGPYTANNFPAPIAEDLRTRRRKKGSRSLIGQGDISVSVGYPGGTSDDLCVMLSMSHSRPAPCLSLMRDDTRQRAHARVMLSQSVAYGNEATGRRSGVEGGGFGKKQCRLRQESERAVENGESANALRKRALREPSHFATLRSSN